MSTDDEHEIRALFDEWLEGAARKDLDAVMSKIAVDVVSYEHDSRLQHLGAPAVREVCARGFDAMAGELRWDIPDLHVIVRGDLAITWGMNRMRAQQGDHVYESWSRGTRIFQRVAGRWLLIHQHVSYPYDPATGRTLTDLRP